MPLRGRAPRVDLPPFRPGDTVRVHVKIKEGEKERTQVSKASCCAAAGATPPPPSPCARSPTAWAVERVFPVESPNVEKVEIKSRGHVRRSRLYYLRALRGKKARLRTKLRDLSALVPIPPSRTAAKPTPTPPSPPEATEAEEESTETGEASESVDEK